MLDAKSRVAAAQSELNARLQIRASIQIAHVVVAGAVIGACVNAVTQEQLKNILIIMISLILPLISLYFVSLYARNEVQLGKCAAYLVILEEWCIKRRTTGDDGPFWHAMVAKQVRPTGFGGVLASIILSTASIVLFLIYVFLFGIEIPLILHI